MPIIDLAPYQAQRIVAENLRAWGRKKNYFVTLDELMIFLRAKAEVVEINRPNGDGTYTHLVKYRGREFRTVSRTKIAL